VTKLPHNRLFVWRCDLWESIPNARSCPGLHNGLGRDWHFALVGGIFLRRSSRTGALLLHRVRSGAALLVAILRAANWVESATGKGGLSDACSKCVKPVSGASRRRL